MLGLLFMFLLGVLVLSMNVIMPLFLQNARGYPILTAALVMMPRGLGSLFGLVLAGQLSGKMDPRLQIAIGFASTAYSAWLFSTFTTDVGLWAFIFAAFFNGIGIGLIFVPLTAVSFWTLQWIFGPRLLRLLACSAITVVALGCRSLSACCRGRSRQVTLPRRTYDPYNEVMKEPHLPLQWDIFTAEGLRLLDAEVTRQAMAIGFLNDFKLIFIGAMISVPLVMLLSRPKGSETV